MPRGSSGEPPQIDSPAWRWVRAGLIALGVAALCAVAVKMISKKVRDLTPAELMTEMQAGSAKLDNTIDTLKRMDFENRREVMQSPEAQKYFQSLKPEDRKRLIIETLDRGIVQQIERYHKLTKPEREEFIAEMKKRQQEAREQFMNLSKEEQDARRKMLNDANFEQVVEKALKSYLSVSTSEERAELAPLYEGALQNVRFIRSGGELCE